MLYHEVYLKILQTIIRAARKNKINMTLHVITGMEKYNEVTRYKQNLKPVYKPFNHQMEAFEAIKIKCIWYLS